MNGITPESNRLKLTQLEGEMSTLKAEIKGQMDVQSNNIEHMKESSQRIEKSVTEMSTKVSGHVNRLFEISDTQGQALGKMSQKLNGHETLCENRDEAIKTQIQSGFTNLETKMATEKSNTKENKEDKKSRTGLYVTIAIAIIGWLWAALG